MQKSSLSRMKKHVPSLVFIVLLFSLGSNLYSYLVIQPSMRAASNNKDNRAFEEWTHLLGFVTYVLDKASTNFEVEDAWTLSRTADRVSQIFTPTLKSAGGLTESLGHEIGYAMMWLDESTNAMFSGNQTGTVTLRELEPAILGKIENLTAPVKAIAASARAALLHDNYGSLSQWLDENDLTSPLINHCEKIREVGQEIYDYYFG